MAGGVHSQEPPYRQPSDCWRWLLLSAAFAVENARLFEESQLPKEVADAATKAKSDLLANMSHEIRTPMNAIIGLSSLVGKTELNREQQDYADKIQVSAHLLLGIINDILDFSKIEAGKLDIENVDFELSEVFDNLLIRFLRSHQPFGTL